MSFLLPYREKITRSSPKKVTLRSIKGSFGDGYDQKAARGSSFPAIGSANTRDTWDLTWEKLLLSELVTLQDFFILHGTWDIIDFTPPFETNSKNFRVTGELTSSFNGYAHWTASISLQETTVFPDLWASIFPTPPTPSYPLTPSNLTTTTPSYYLDLSETEVYTLSQAETTTVYIRAVKKDGSGSRTVIGMGYYGSGLTFDGTNIWGTSTFVNNLSKFSTTGTQLLALFNYSPGQVHYYLGHIYHIFYNQIVKYTFDGTVVASYTGIQFQSTGLTPANFCFEGDNIWVCQSMTDGDKVLKFSVSGATITYVADYTVTSTKRITYDGIWIWVSNGTSTLYRINPASGTTTSYVIPELTTATINWVKYLPTLNLTVITCSDNKIRYINTTVTPPTVFATVNTGIDPQEPVADTTKIYVANYSSNYLTLIS